MAKVDMDKVRLMDEEVYTLLDDWRILLQQRPDYEIGGFKRRLESGSPAMMSVNQLHGQFAGKYSISQLRGSVTRLEDAGRIKRVGRSRGNNEAFFATHDEMDRSEADRRRHLTAEILEDYGSLQNLLGRTSALAGWVEHRVRSMEQTTNLDSDPIEVRDIYWKFLRVARELGYEEKE